MEELGKDYADYFRKTDLAKELNPINATVEDMLTRLEEYESLLTSVKADSKTTIEHNISEIASHKEEFETIFKRIDDLEKLVNTINENLDTVEQTVDIAEEELGVTNYSIKGLLKPLFGKAKDPNVPRTNLENGQFKRPEIFRADDYFGKSKENE